MSGFRLRLAVAGCALGVYEAALARLGGAVVTGPPESDPAPVDVYLSAAPDRAEVMPRKPSVLKNDCGMPMTR